jgi:nitroreductase
MFIAGTEAGLMSQNVYLYCSATNLNTVLIALVNREKLHEEIGLQENETIVYTQVVGKSP